MEKKLKFPIIKGKLKELVPQMEIILTKGKIFLVQNSEKDKNRMNYISLSHFSEFQQ